MVIGDFDRAGLDLTEAQVVVVLLERYRHVEELPAICSAQAQLAVHLTQREALMTKILLELITNAPYQSTERHALAERKTYRADLGEEAHSGAKTRVGAVENRQAHSPFLPLAGAGEIHIHRRQQHMKGRRLVVVGNLLHAVEQLHRKALHPGVARRLGVVPGGEQRLGQHLVFAQPIITVAGVAGRLQVALVGVDKVDVGRRQWLGGVPLLQGAVELREGLQHLAEAPAVEDQVMSLGTEAVVIIIKFDQEKTAQWLAAQGVGPSHLRLHQGLACRGWVGQRGEIMQRHFHLQLRGECLPRQAIGVGVQLGA